MRSLQPEVELFFERLIPTLPEAIGAQLEWVTRSPLQESVAERMRDEGLPFADRVVRYRDLVPQGQVTVYNEGITAGRLLLVRRTARRPSPMHATTTSSSWPASPIGSRRPTR